MYNGDVNSKNMKSFPSHMGQCWSRFM